MSEGLRDKSASRCDVSLQCDIPTGHLEISKRASSLDISDHDYYHSSPIQDNPRIIRDGIFEGLREENASTRDVSLQCDILRGHLETSKRVSTLDVADLNYQSTSAIGDKRRIKRSPFEFDDISRSISTIEAKMRSRSSIKNESHLTPFVKKNLFSLSQFHDDEVQVDEDTEENSGGDQNQTTGSLSDFIVQAEPICNTKPLFHQFPSKSPNVRIGNIMDINEYAKKFVVPSASSCEHPKKRRRLYISSSSDSE